MLGTESHPSFMLIVVNYHQLPPLDAHGPSQLLLSSNLCYWVSPYNPRSYPPFLAKS